MDQLIRFSNTAMTVDSDANAMNTKNKQPHTLPSGHLPEHHRQRHEHQRRALIRGNTISEARREDDEARQDGHHGVQRGDGDRLAGKATLATDARSEDLHGRNAQRQAEKRLAMAAYTASPNVDHPSANRRPKSGTR